MGKGVAIYYKSDLNLFNLKNIVLKSLEGISDNPIILASSSRHELTAVQKTFSDFITVAFRKRNKA
jgi:hypothetical protein